MAPTTEATERTNGQALRPEEKLAPRYFMAWTPKGRGSWHWTTDGQSSLCNRPVDRVEEREPTDQERSLECGLCSIGKARGSRSPAIPRGQGKAKVARAPQPQSPLMDKAAELEALAAEIRQIREREKAAVARFEALKREFSQFLNSVDVSTT